MEIFAYINAALGIIFTLCYMYQVIYIPIALFKKNKPHKAIKMHKYAILIAARNEATVIEHLINSLKNQTYPAELFRIFVVADNCTDNTAEIARSCGAEVYERFNTEQVGKGYALDYLITKIQEAYGEEAFDGYMVFDADNVAAKNFVEEMNKTFSDGYRAVTSYRNSKNYGDSWISAGSSMWFLRDSQFLNRARMKINSSCLIAGTGFLVHRDVLKKTGGWKYFLIVEDTEFTVRQMIDGEKIGYCENAMVFDEQPVGFGVSWKQRMRWAYGGWVVLRAYGKRLVKRIFTGPSYSCFDMFMSFFPAMFLSMLILFFNVVSSILTCIIGQNILLFFTSMLQLAINLYSMFFLVSLTTTIAEWKRIYCPSWKKILYIFTFPIFMITYIPMPAFAMFRKVEWKPVEHNRSKDLSEIMGSDK